MIRTAEERKSLIYVPFPSKTALLDPLVTFHWISRRVSDPRLEGDTKVRVVKGEGIAFRQPLESQLFRVHLSLVFLHANYKSPA